MRFFGRHGVLDEERRTGQEFVVDVDLRLDLRPAGTDDDLTQTVDYRLVYDKIRAIVEGEPVRLIETVAERIAVEMFGLDRKIAELEVTVRKPQVMLPGKLDASAVVIRRTRS